LNFFKQKSFSLILSSVLKNKATLMQRFEAGYRPSIGKIEDSTTNDEQKEILSTEKKDNTTNGKQTEVT